MNALILAAGIGTRLLPYTLTRPKPLFTLSGQPLMDRLIYALHRAGAEAVILNTHHLAEQVRSHIERNRYPIPVRLSHEPSILGTGGAIANNAAVLGEKPFFVINGDILTDIDFQTVYNYHLAHGGPATLVLVNDTEFNRVIVESNGKVHAFQEDSSKSIPDGFSKLTFTGIQVIDRQVLGYIPKIGFSHSIDAYRRMLLDGKPIYAFVADHAYWKDIGTPARYCDASLNALSTEAFHKAWPRFPETLQHTRKEMLPGDGSDRAWFRLFRNEKSLVAVNHGIQTESRSGEMESWIKIGRFLKTKGVPVPDIHAFDTFSGWAVMEDLGDVSLQGYLQNTPSSGHRFSIYQKVIEHLIEFSVEGTRGFDLRWAYQTPIYDQNLIVERECRYFLDAFVNHYLGLDIPQDMLEEEFQLLARQAMEHSLFGLMHRDFQSRNIMVANGNIFFIDFQGARIGPIQYDLASLLIDPYVDLPVSLQDMLLDFAIKRLTQRRTLNPDRFREGYRIFAVCRNLQVLGAFAYLTRVKCKTAFAAYIPTAVTTLSRLMGTLPVASFPRLKALTERIATAVGF